MQTETKHKKGYYRILGIAFGIPLGIPLGLAMGNITYGPLIGILIGLLIGQVMEAKYNSKDTDSKSFDTPKSKRRLLVIFAWGLFILTIFIAEYFYLISNKQ